MSADNDLQVDRAERALNHIGASMQQLDRLIGMCKILSNSDRAWRAATLECQQIRNGMDVARHELCQLYAEVRNV